MLAMSGTHFSTKRVQINKTLPLLIILVGFALRLYQLGVQSLWYDETVSAFLAAQPVTDLIAHTTGDIHPPGYYLLLHTWQQFSGSSEFALAFFSLMFGILLIPLTYLLARHVVNQQTALWVAGLIAISPYNVWYSQEVRMYTLGAATGLLAGYCALRALQGDSRQYWLGYVVAAAVGLYTLYYFAFLLIALNLLFLFYVLYPKANLTAIRSLFIGNALVLIAYLPWLPIAWRQAINPPVPPWRSPPALWSIAVESWSALSLGQSVEPAAVWPILIVTLALFLLGLDYLIKIDTHPTPSSPSPNLHIPPASFLLTYTFGPLMLIVLFSFISPLYHVRYVFTYSPAFCVVLGAGITWLATRIRFWVAVVALLVLVTASLYSLYQFHFNPRYRSDDFRAAVQFIQQRWQPGDVIVTNAGYTYTAFVYYSHLPNLERHRLVPYWQPEQPGQVLLLQTGTVDGPPQLGWGNARSDFYAMSAADTIAALEQLSHDFPRLWMLRAYDTVTDPNALIRTWLDEHTIPLEDQLFSGESNIRAQGFLLAGQPPPENQTIPFEDGMVLAGWHLPQQSWEAGQVIPIKLWWTTIAPPTTDYKMSLKTWSSNGQLAAQGKDDWPVGALYRATAWPTGQIVYHPTQLVLPPDLPPGQYWLNVELYHPDTIQPLPRLDNGETTVTLGPVVVQ